MLYCCGQKGHARQILSTGRRSMHHPLLSGRRLGFCLLLFTAPFAAQADTITLAPTEDTYVAELYPSTPRYEDAGRVTIMQFMSPRADSYFKFDLSSIPSSQTIVGATLWLYQTTDGNAPYGPQGTSLYRMDGNNWSQTTLAWGNQPSFTTSLFGTSNDGGLHTGWSSWTWSATAADRRWTRRRPTLSSRCSWRRVLPPIRRTFGWARTIQAIPTCWPLMAAGRPRTWRSRREQLHRRFRSRATWRW